MGEAMAHLMNVNLRWSATQGNPRPPAWATNIASLNNTLQELYTKIEFMSVNWHYTWGTITKEDKPIFHLPKRVIHGETWLSPENQGGAHPSPENTHWYDLLFLGHTAKQYQEWFIEFTATRQCMSYQVIMTLFKRAQRFGLTSRHVGGILSSRLFEHLYRSGITEGVWFEAHEISIAVLNYIVALLDGCNRSDVRSWNNAEMVKALVRKKRSRDPYYVDSGKRPKPATGTGPAVNPASSNAGAENAVMNARILAAGQGSAPHGGSHTQDGKSGSTSSSSSGISGSSSSSSSSNSKKF